MLAKETVPRPLGSPIKVVKFSGANKPDNPDPTSDPAGIQIDSVNVIVSSEAVAPQLSKIVG